MRCASLVSGLLVARAAAQLATFKQCDVRVEALERGGGCLAVDAAAVNATLAPPEGTTACDDSATWTDGTNGCAQYEAAAARGDDWCDEFGALGASTEAASAAAGDEPSSTRRVTRSWSNARAPLDGVVQAVRPAAGFAYDVKVTARFRKPAVYRVKSESDLQPGRRPRRCSCSPAPHRHHRWRLDIEGDDAVLEHVETNCTRRRGRRRALGLGAVRGPTPLPSASRPLRTSRGRARECLVGGSLASRHSSKRRGRPKSATFSVVAYYMRYGRGGGGRGARRAHRALLARPDASTLPPWEVWAWPGRRAPPP